MMTLPLTIRIHSVERENDTKEFDYPVMLDVDIHRGIVNAIIESDCLKDGKKINDACYDILGIGKSTYAPYDMVDVECADSHHEPKRIILACSKGDDPAAAVDEWMTASDKYDEYTWIRMMSKEVVDNLLNAGEGNFLGIVTDDIFLLSDDFKSYEDFITACKGLKWDKYKSFGLYHISMTDN